MGLPYENLSKKRTKRLLGIADRHRLFFSRGMFSDDTEHTVMVARSLYDSKNDPVQFSQILKRELKKWSILMPAGTGKATLKACFKLWLGISPIKSGVFSAGNGPLMRAPILGVCIDDPDSLKELVSRSTKITHTDPKALWSALTIAVAANIARQTRSDLGGNLIAKLTEILPKHAKECLEKVEDVADSVCRGETTEQYAIKVGYEKGVSGYCYSTMEVALHCWLESKGNYQSDLTGIVHLGGDTDTVAAIAGGLVGASFGAGSIPTSWIQGISDWPLSTTFLTDCSTLLQKRFGDCNVAGQSSNHCGERFPGLPVWGLLPRNMFFLLVVLVHGFRRLAPPY